MIAFRTDVDRQTVEHALAGVFAHHQGSPEAATPIVMSVLQSHGVGDASVVVRACDCSIHVQGTKIGDFTFGRAEQVAAAA